MASKPYTAVLELADVKLDHLALLDGTLGIRLTDDASLRRVREWRGRPSHVNKWSGGSADQTRDWIRNGYKAPGSPVTGRVDAAPRKRTRWREEGDELSLERAWSGDPTPFASREPGTKAGITITADLNMLASTGANVLRDYGAWLASLVAGYTASGHDVELYGTYPCEGLFSKGPRVTNHKIRLKRFGQQSDYTAWSPLFSPTGFRHIIFAMWAIDAARKGFVCDSGLGHSTNDKPWGVQFDPATTTLTIERPASAASFPAERMTELVKAAFTP